ncbi:MAG TPA: energy transducer TonB [Gemmatimonadales bacterium]|nr:energy transducer TonB [Gemmatimonadales bacterium]
MRSAPVVALGLAACAGGAAPGTTADSPPRFEVPVMVNPESPVSYPEDMFAQRVEGTVLLRLFVDARGVVVPESTRLAESSGFPALDSAAVAGVPRMRFAPGRRDGEPVATAFVQPVQFRHPERSTTGAP